MMRRVLLVGCGDVALRTAHLLRSKVRLYGLTRREADIPKLRAHGIVPIVGDLDRLSTLRRLRAAPFAVLHFAPPPSDGRDDPRTQRLIAALSRARSIPQRFVYISTSTRLTVGLRAEIGERVILKAEGTLNREMDIDFSKPAVAEGLSFPVIPNDVVTTSLVIKY